MNQIYELTKLQKDILLTIPLFRQLPTTSRADDKVYCPVCGQRDMDNENQQGGVKCLRCGCLYSIKHFEGYWR